MLQTVETRSHIPLPIAIEEIDRSWLTSALRVKAPDVTVRDFEIVDINHGTCTKIRLRLDMDEAGKAAGIPETVILKGGFESHSRGLDFMHEKEIRGYRDVVPINPLPTPICYFADFDAERGQGIVIIEDLVARGVTFCSALVPHSFDQIADRLAVLARYHSASYASARLEPGGVWEWAKQPLPLFQMVMEKYLVPETWQRFVDSPRGAAVSTRFHCRQWMADTLNRLERFAAGLPHCIVHGDTHLGNLYIDRDGTPGFFDVAPLRAPPMLEISYHVTCAADLADRRRWEGALVQHYLDALRSHGADVPAFDDAMRQYAIFLSLGYCIFLINESFFQPEAINTAYTARFSQAMLDLDTIGLLEALD